MVVLVAAVIVAVAAVLAIVRVVDVLVVVVVIAADVVDETCSNSPKVARVRHPTTLGMTRTRHHPDQTEACVNHGTILATHDEGCGEKHSS